ncbi:penicillin-binding transpeptidase domain-containing protein [Thalassiella azotivora]
MGRRGRNGLLAALAAVVVVALVAGFLVLRHRDREAQRDDAARRAAEQVAVAWSAGDLTGAPWDGDPAAVQEEYAAVVAGLGEVPPTVEVADVTRSPDDGSTGTATLQVTWPFGPDGWSYAREVPLAEEDPSRWTAQWSTGLVAPDVQAGDTLSTRRVPAQRADLLATDGSVLVGQQPVVVVGVQPSRVQDVAALSTTLAGLLDVDAAALAEQVRGASPDAFVEVITLRRPDYDALRDRLQPLPGTVFRESTLPLAPTREFARALLGTVGPVTAELVEESGGRLAAGDTAGLSGLQRQYDERLGGTAGLTVVRARGEETTELFGVEPVDGTPVTLTLDAHVQQTADAALASAAPGANAALVAVRVGTGEVLAVANTPASGTNRAMTGQYPPGSTFKTISTQALLAAGLTPDQVVPCPPTATVDGRSFRNFEGGAAGDVPFRTDFAESCNTAFVSLSTTLDDAALNRAAAAMGLGVDWSVGADAYTGSVPVSESPVDKAAATIGQGRVLASPLGMAVAAGTIARGSWAAPSLVVDPAPAPGATPPQPVADLGTVRELMRGVVTGGTAAALADVPGEPVHAKTGTAEYGAGDPPPTHAWTIGFQGDVAFAVLVEDGESGGRVAVPVAEAFLRGLA